MIPHYRRRLNVWVQWFQNRLISLRVLLSRDRCNATCVLQLTFLATPTSLSLLAVTPAEPIRTPLDRKMRDVSNLMLGWRLTCLRFTREDTVSSCDRGPGICGSGLTWALRTTRRCVYFLNTQSFGSFPCFPKVSPLRPLQQSSLYKFSSCLQEHLLLADRRYSLLAVIRGRLLLLKTACFPLAAQERQYTKLTDKGA